jgi:CRP-like cAMP-binding protein
MVWASSAAKASSPAVLSAAAKATIGVGLSLASSAAALAASTLVRGDAVDHPWVGSLPISQQDIADMVSMSRRTVARTLRTLSDAGVISTGRRRLTIHPIAALRILPDSLVGT